MPGSGSPITPWDRLAHVASHHYLWQDSIVQADFGVALRAALSGPKRLTKISGAGHNDWPGRVDAAWRRMATDFVLGATAAST
jgi:hypothetical protein